MSVEEFYTTEKVFVGRPSDFNSISTS